METKPLSISRLKELITEIFYGKQDKVTKVTDNSAINAIFYAMAKVGQKGLVDIANVEAQLFPEFATGSTLDNVANRSGVPSRFGAIGSSTFIRLVGTPGTQYISGTNTFINTAGVEFEITQDVTLSSDGYTYVSVRSRDVGQKTNVEPNTITNVVPEPVGHEYVINEFRAVGGADEEDDQSFRQRIIDYSNLLSESTIEKLNQVFISINNNVLRTIYRGLSLTGKNRLAILTQNGSELSNSDLDTLLSGASKYLSISDSREFGNNITGVELENVEFYPIDVDFRIEFVQNTDPDLFRIDVQTKFARQVDYRFWNDGDTVEWDDLLQIVKDSQGAKSVPDKRFSPQSDIEIPVGQFPRFRSFIIRDLAGNIIVDASGNLDPVFFSNEVGELQSII